MEVLFGYPLQDPRTYVLLVIALYPHTILKVTLSDYVSFPGKCRSGTGQASLTTVLNPHTMSRDYSAIPLLWPGNATQVLDISPSGHCPNCHTILVVIPIFFRLIDDRLNRSSKNRFFPDFWKFDFRSFDDRKIEF